MPTITLKYATLEVELFAPDFGDQQQLKLNTKIRRSMTGQAWTYVNKSATRHLSWTISHLNQPKIREVEAFIRESAGNKIEIHEFLDGSERVWEGFILNEPLQTTHQAVRNTPFNIDFEGVITSG